MWAGTTPPWPTSPPTWPSWPSQEWCSPNIMSSRYQCRLPHRSTIKHLYIFYIFSLNRLLKHKYWTKGVLPEPRSLVDRALPVSHWETGVIVIVNQIDIINYDAILFWRSNFLSSPFPFIPLTIMNTKPKGSMMEMKSFSEGNHQTTSTHWPYPETQATIRLIEKVFLKYPSV